MSDEIRISFRFDGQVQGVGFRYRAYYAANQLSLTGWVDNNPDGSVSMEVQGREEDISRLVSMISDGTYIDICSIDKKKIPIVDDEYDFRIRGY